MQPSKKARTKQTTGSTPAENVRAYVSANRTRALTMPERLDILTLQSNLRSGVSGVTITGPVTNAVAVLLFRSRETAGRVWSEFQQNGTISVSTVAANNDGKVSRLPQSVQMEVDVHEFIQTRCLTRTRTVARDVMALLVENGYMCIDTTNETAVKSALRCVQRYLVKQGYKRGKRKGSTYRLSPANELKRDIYLTRMSEIQAENRRVIYMDESYIHQNYACHDDSLFNPTDPVIIKPKHKERRLCFVAAIIDADKSVTEDDRTDFEKAHLIKESIDIFEGCKQTKDYHGMFNGAYLVQWMQKLLDDIEAKGLSRTVIVTDNAKNHLTKPEGVPKSGDAKAYLQAAYTSYAIEFHAKETRKMLWAKLEVYLNAHVRPVIVQMAADQGHEVLFTPPHYSDLQPIEIVWANIKGAVGRQYTTETSFQDLRVRLDAAFESITTKTVQGCIDRAQKRFEELRAIVEDLEDAPE